MVTYNSLIDGLLKFRRISYDLEFVNQMHHKVQPPNILTYSSILEILLGWDFTNCIAFALANILYSHFISCGVNLLLSHVVLSLTELLFRHKLGI